MGKRTRRGKAVGIDGLGVGSGGGVGVVHGVTSRIRMGKE